MVLNWLIVYSILFIVQLIKDIPACCALLRRIAQIKHKRYSFSQQVPPLSVIISVKDSSQALQRNLPHILQQDYPEFEVIVVNDNSIDDTEEVLKRFGANNRHLYHTFVPDSTRYISHKKLALTMGIRASRYDWLVFTEADCCPASKDWLKMLARNISGDIKVVLGYSNYQSSSSGWFNRKIVYDTLMNQIHFLGTAIMGHPYTGCGRNMAYHKSLFMENKGYSAHLELLRGEDDLFINQYATKENTAVEIDSAAAVRQALPYPRIWRENSVSRKVTSRMHQGAISRSFISFWITLSMYLFYIISALFIAYGIYTATWLLPAISTSSLCANYLIKCWSVNRVSSLLGEQYRYYFSYPLLEWFRPIGHLGTEIRYLFRKKSDFYRR